MAQHNDFDNVADCVLSCSVCFHRKTTNHWHEFLYEITTGTGVLVTLGGFIHQVQNGLAK